jgi:hypothetical protein
MLEKRKMFDDILDIISGYNLITPLASFFQDIINGPHFYFGIPSMAGWTKREIGRILSRHGINVWGLIYDGDVLIFTVRQDQARWAYYVLTREGVPILYPTAEAVGFVPRADHIPQNPNSIMERIFRVMERIG